MSYIIVNEKPGHTVVKVRVAGKYFMAQACSTCGIISDYFPSFRKQKTTNSCVVCGTSFAQPFDELDDYLCDACVNEYFDWKKVNAFLLPVDFLRERLHSELRSL